MSEARSITAVASVLAAMSVIGSMSPAVEAWLNWAVLWTLGIGVGGPLLWWVGREVAGEIGLARELRRHRPHRVAPGPPAEVTDR